MASNIETFSGIIPIDKPKDWTSFDVVAKIRGIIRNRQRQLLPPDYTGKLPKFKIGHAGTLDPMATGVLPVFVGRDFTKTIDTLPNTDKTYMADFKLGITTDTQDITGNVISQSNIGVTDEDIRVIITEFRGDIFQIPPMYSAVKVGGKKLYELARKGIEVERKPKKVTIHDITLAGFYEGEGSIIVTCSSGTYIRTLIHDIGQRLKCGAVMTELIRTKACGYALKDCLSIDEVGDLIHNS